MIVLPLLNPVYQVDHNYLAEGVILYTDNSFFSVQGLCMAVLISLQWMDSVIDLME